MPSSGPPLPAGRHPPFSPPNHLRIQTPRVIPAESRVGTRPHRHYTYTLTPALPTSSPALPQAFDFVSQAFDRCVPSFACSLCVFALHVYGHGLSLHGRIICRTISQERCAHAGQAYAREHAHMQSSIASVACPHAHASPACCTDIPALQGIIRSRWPDPARSGPPMGRPPARNIRAQSECETVFRAVSGPARPGPQPPGLAVEGRGAGAGLCTPPRAAV
jgi:hypothetical protein